MLHVKRFLMCVQDTYIDNLRVIWAGKFVSFIWTILIINTLSIRKATILVISYLRDRSFFVREGGGGGGGSWRGGGPRKKKFGKERGGLDEKNKIKIG